MSDGLPGRNLGSVRRLRKDERALITKLVMGTPFEDAVLRQISDARVQDMPDGGMGSIKFYRKSPNKRKFGKEIAEGSFHDADGVVVSVTLNLDQFGDPFELDVWKVDNSPLIRYPDPNDFEIVKRDGTSGYTPQRP